MNLLSTTKPASDAFHPHADFLHLRPIIDRHTRVVFRTSTQVDREEASAEAVAAAFESYLRLKRRGKDPVHSFPSLMATFAARHVKDGRHVGGRRSSSDALSFTAQQKHVFRVASLKRRSFERRFLQSTPEAFDEHLTDNTQTPILDQVCFRIDWPAFLRTLRKRDRAMIKFLMLGNSATAAAKKFGLTGGRVTQLRQQWHRDWRNFQGETVANA